MNEFTAHTQLPDTVLGLVLFDLVSDQPEVDSVNLQGGAGTWLSFGVSAEYDHEAITTIKTVRMRVSKMTRPGMDEDTEISIRAFDFGPMLVMNGRTIIYSEGI